MKFTLARAIRDITAAFSWQATAAVHAATAICRQTYIAVAGLGHHSVARSNWSTFVQLSFRHDIQRGRTTLQQQMTGRCRQHGGSGDGSSGHTVHYKSLMLLLLPVYRPPRRWKKTSARLRWTDEGTNGMDDEWILVCRVGVWVDAETATVDAAVKELPTFRRPVQSVGFGPVGRPSCRETDGRLNDKSIFNQMRSQKTNAF